ncbi:hypothetical protein WJX72_010656 [[Myrmecia] bisecta]|uniref:mannan endo-1,4-beta-mannosidase n=1 Tax=[Myrmecia] bisecta TaxID=41462 RepID=A0AAW1QA55_9CHLO
MKPTSPQEVVAEFVDTNCQSFYFVGGNVWEALEVAGGLIKPPLGGSSALKIDDLFSQAQDNGLKVVRLFVGGVTPDLAVQPQPGRFNESAFRALDSIIKAANDHDVKLILSLTDNWHVQDGKLGYVLWANQTDPDTFFTNPQIIGWYKNFIHTITSRVNTQTGVPYNQEPAIFAWDLINEPRTACNVTSPNASCDASAAKSIQNWIQNVSGYLKTQDSNHMVTVGEEGFYPAGSPNVNRNPTPGTAGGDWPTKTGQDFLNNHRPATIDFASFHLWPDNWEINDTSNAPVKGLAAASDWVNAHLSDAASLGKPAVLEEFGKDVPLPITAQGIASKRNPYFASVFSRLNDSITHKGVLKGAAFWEWHYLPGSDIVKETIFPLPNDTTWTNIIVPTAQNVVKHQPHTPVPNCVPG